MSLTRNETSESSEKYATVAPEEMIVTSDDLKASYDQSRMENFDDLRSSYQSKESKTLDDLKTSYYDQRDTPDTTAETEAGKSTGAFDNRADLKDIAFNHQKSGELDGAQWGRDTPELLDQRRMNQSAEEIRQMNWMEPDKWKALSNDEKVIALEHSGTSLRDAYNTPEPPLAMCKESADLQGSYGDGYSYDASTGRIDGSDYGIKLNEDAITQRGTRLSGDDPREALTTYGHEFRHSYQSEQAERFDKGLATDNPVRAQEWSENLKNPKAPPDATLAETDPERYSKEFDAYVNQPVERDARDFGSRLASEVYDKRRS